MRAAGGVFSPIRLHMTDAGTFLWLRNFRRQQGTFVPAADRQGTSRPPHLTPAHGHHGDRRAECVCVSVCLMK